MASVTDLDGMLRADEDNLEIRLSDFLTKNAGHPFTVFARWRAHGGSSSERFENITGTAAPEGVGNVLAALEKQITDRLGPQPFGTLRVQGYRSGESRTPTLDMSRTLMPPDSGGLGDPNVALLRSLLSAERADRRAMQQDLRGAFGDLTVLVGSQAQSIGTLGTVRTAASASSDLAGLPTLGAFVVLMLLWPSIKAWLGLRPDADVNAVIRAAQDRAKQIAAGTLAPGDLAQIPGETAGQALHQIPGPAPAAEQADGDQVDGDQVDDDPREVLRLPAEPGPRAAVLLDRLLEDAEDLAALLVIGQKLSERPELLGKLLQRMPPDKLAAMVAGMPVPS